jgi:transcriptional regulator GlxA family with amidase domain
VGDVRVAVIVPPNFKDETVSALGLFLAKNGMVAEISGFSSKACRGCHGATVRPEKAVADVDPASISAIVIADGPGMDDLRLYDYRPLLNLLRALSERNRLIVGIGNGIKAIARANVIRDANVARVDSDVANLVRLYHGTITDDYLVLDKNILTLSDSNRIDELVARMAKELGTL